MAHVPPSWSHGDQDVATSSDYAALYVYKVVFSTWDYPFHKTMYFVRCSLLIYRYSFTLCSLVVPFIHGSSWNTHMAVSPFFQDAMLRPKGLFKLHALG